MKTLSIVRLALTAEERMTLFFEQIVYGMILFPESYGWETVRAIPDGASDFIDGDLLTAWRYVLQDAKAHDGKIEKSRILAAANGVGDFLEEYFDELLDRDLAENPGAVIKGMEAVIDEGIQEEIAASGEGDEERAAIIESDQEEEAAVVVAPSQVEAELAHLDAGTALMGLLTRILNGEMISNPNLVVRIPKGKITGLTTNSKAALARALDDVRMHGSFNRARAISEAGPSKGEIILTEYALRETLDDSIPSMKGIEEWILRENESVKAPKAALSTVPVTKAGEAAIPFPAEVMTGLAGDFAKLYSSTLEAPPHFFYTAFLTCLGSLVSGRLYLASEIAQQPRLYVLLLGESGNPRKSTAVTKTVDFFNQAVPDFRVCLGVGSAEGLQGMMEKQNRLLLAIDEMKHFVSKCKNDGSVLLPCVNTLFESNRYESHTKTSKVKLENVHLSILAASTIETYENTWSAAFTHIGFNNRLWIVTGEGKRMFSIPREIADQERFPLRQRLARILSIAEDRGKMAITPEAHKIYDEWYFGRENSIHMTRLDTYALRLMPLLAINDLKTEIDAETVRKVLALANYQFKVRILHDPIDADNLVAGVEEKIRRILKSKGPQTARELKKAVHYERTGVFAYSRAIDNLIKVGDVGYDAKAGLFFPQPGITHE